MNCVLAQFLSLAMAVHSVLGCCWHDARSVSTPHGSRNAGGCVCHSHAHSLAESALPDAPAKEAPQRDHECHGTKCVGVLAEESQELEQSVGSDSLWQVQAALVVHIADIESREDRWREDVLASAPMCPVRTHLFLGVLLI
jgi:hypothetical protein